MHSNEGPLHALPYRLRSARQKRRSQKEDFEKQLIQLHNQRIQLQADKARLPWIPLAEPYQKGWKRSFVLREDVWQSKQADFYQTLLDKINTTQYSKDKGFKVKKRKRRKRVYEVKKQSLREFSEWDWSYGKLKLTETEKMLFYRQETWSAQSRCFIIQYVFIEPWRFVLQVRPHMITHMKMIDADLEARIQQLENYIENKHLNYKIFKITNGRSRHSWKKEFEIKPQYHHPFRNMSLHSILEELKEQKI